MRRHSILTGVLAIAFAGTGHATASDEAATPTSLFLEGDWHRIASPDGEVSAQFPCSTAEVERRSEKGAFSIECRKKGLLFVLTSGMTATTGPTAGQVARYEWYVSSFSGLPSEEVKQSTIAGHRAITVVCPDREGVACIQIVDLKAGRPLLVAVKEISLDPAVRTQSLEAGRKFYQSLEIRAK